MEAIKKIMVILIVVMHVSGCATAYKSQYVPFRPPEAFVNKQEVAGISIGAEAYVDREEALDAFGFDIREAGLLPVQLVMNNLSGATLKIVTEQTFLVDDQGQYWQVVPNHVTVDRVEKSTQLAALGKGAARGSLWGAAGGAILGAALGIVSGKNVGNAVGKGAVLGGAGGAVIGTSRESASTERQVSIINDVRSKGLEGKIIPQDHLANGFIFFPGEAKNARAVKLQIRETGSGETHSVTLDLVKQKKP